MTDRELLELIAAEVGGLKNSMGGLENRMQKIENIVTNIEQDHGEKLKALFDGYYQHTDILERIEKEVSKQEEIIMRRVK
jgi:archaellum component FlaC